MKKTKNGGKRRENVKKAGKGGKRQKKAEKGENFPSIFSSIK